MLKYVLFVCFPIPMFVFQTRIALCYSAFCLSLYLAVELVISLDMCTECFRLNYGMAKDPVNLCSLVMLGSNSIIWLN